MLLRQGPLEVTLTLLACLLCTYCSVHDANVLPSGLNQVAAEDVRNSGKQVLLVHDLSTKVQLPQMLVPNELFPHSRK